MKADPVAHDIAHKRRDAHHQQDKHFAGDKFDGGEGGKNDGNANNEIGDAAGVNFFPVKDGAAKVGKKLCNRVQDHGGLHGDDGYKNAHQNHATGHPQNTGDERGAENANDNQTCDRKTKHVLFLAGDGGIKKPGLGAE